MQRTLFEKENNNNNNSSNSALDDHVVNIFKKKKKLNDYAYAYAVHSNNTKLKRSERSV